MPPRSYFEPPDSKHQLAVLVELGRTDIQIGRYEAAPLSEAFDIAVLMGISPYALRYFLMYPAKHYRSFTIKKKRGGLRTINAPRTWLKVVQWWILDNILSKYPLPPYVFGFAKGRNAAQNADYHAGQSHILNVDIENFFPSIGFTQVAQVFAAFGYSRPVCEFLARLCCFNETLPQGAPTSPAIANLVARDLDKDLLNYARTHELKYSRYADDLTFSSTARIPMRMFE